MPSLHLFSADSKEALVAALESGRTASLDREPGARRPHRAAILAHGDREFDQRRLDAAARLRSQERERFNIANHTLYGTCHEDGPPGLAFLFPGFGARHPSLMEDLMEGFPAVRDWWRDLKAESRARFEANPLLFPRKQEPRPAAEISDFRLVLDSILVMNLALFELTRSIGLTDACQAVTGHSYGENAAIFASGMVNDSSVVFDLLGRVCGEFSSLPPTQQQLREQVSMLAITASSRALLEGLAGANPIALDNCPQQAVVCGLAEDITALERAAKSRGEICFRLPGLTVPVHTSFFPLPRAALARIYDSFPLSQPRVKIYSCATSRPFPESPGEIRELLADQWSQPVRFRETVESMYRDGVRTFLELGPGGRLAGFVRDTLRGSDAAAIAVNVEAKPSFPQLQLAMAQLYVRGYSMDLRAFAGDARATTDGGGEPSVAKAGSAAGKTGSPSSLPSMLDVVRQEASKIMGFAEASELDVDLGFFEMGMGSVQVVELMERLQQTLARPLPQTLAFDYPNIRGMAEWLARPADSSPASDRSTRHAPRSDNNLIAIVGAGCRFPGGLSSPSQFWDLLKSGRDAIVPVPAGRWNFEEAEAAGQSVDKHRCILEGGFLPDIAGFDCAFFGISPREALSLDPQQRLLLEVAWEALEHAGIDPHSLRGSRTGVFAGISHSEYAQRLSTRERLRLNGYLGTGNSHSTAAGRISFVFGFVGPCIAVDTACSSSLVAVHLAAQSLREGECNLALAGGVNLLISPETSIYLNLAGALAKDSRCKTFDASADGYVRGEGCGVIVLKRLADAQADGDDVLAIVRGTAVNHDGHTSGFTVPNGPSQQAVIRRALEVAGLAPEDIGYLEAHGTGTQLGDPIEVHALGQVFRNRPSGNPLLLGSVKSNIGHLEAAAGLAGLIKVILQMRHGSIAPTLHQKAQNPKIDWASLPLRVCHSLTDWPAGREACCGVSSFGISGTNAHVILQGSPPPVPRPVADQAVWILPVSARATPSLQARLDALAAPVSSGEIPLGDLCHTAAVGRTHFPLRVAVVGSDAETIRERLTSARPASRPPKRRSLAFLFTGQGSQYRQMGLALMEPEPVFREAMFEMEELFRPFLGVSLLAAIRGEPLANGLELDHTALAQPALFALEYSLVRLWQGWGVQPDMVIGHSLGELTGAWVAGVFSLDDAVALVAHRGRLLQSVAEKGSMLACRAPELQIADILLAEQLPLSVAAVNGENSVVVSGREADVGVLQQRLQYRGIPATRLNVSHAFHSTLVESILPEFHQIASKITYRAPRLPLISNLTGRVAGSEISTASYWVEQVRRTVRFSAGLDTLRAAGCGIFLEIGPKPVLTALAAEDPDSGRVWLPSMQPPAADGRRMFESLAVLYEAGWAINWRGVFAGRGGRRQILPSYPFDRQRHWLDLDRVPHREEVLKQSAPAPAPPKAGGSPILRKLTARSGAAREELLAEYLRKTVLRILGAAPQAALDPTQSFNQLGFDSLMALQLRNELQVDFNLDVNVAVLVDNQTLERLCAMVLDRVFTAANPGLALPIVASTGPSPLSWGQRALWFLWRLAPESAAYNVSLPLRVEAGFDEETVRRASSRMLAAHPLLRAVFQDAADGPVFIVPGSLEPSWMAGDGPPENATLAAAHKHPFDLEHGPVTRFHYFRPTTSPGVLLVTMHHIVVDGWSLELLRQQWPKLLSAAHTAEIPPQPAHTYAGYAAWEAAMLGSAEGDLLWQHWRARLENLPAPLDLPLDYPRTAVQTFRGASVPVELSPALAASIKAVARGEGATLFATFLSAYLLLLHRCCGQDDILTGSPQAGRSRAEFASLVGYFVNPIVIRSRLLPDTTIRELLAETRKTALAALAHAAYPFALLVEKLKVQREPGRSPLFDASFNYNTFQEDLPETDRQDLFQGEGKFSLTLTINEEPSRIRASLGYNTGLFRPQTVALLGRHLVTVLEAMAADLDQKAVLVPLATGPALRGPVTLVAEADHVVTRIQRVAATEADRPAVVGPDGVMSWREMNCFANGLAAELLGAGAGPGARVGICLGDSARFVACIVGIQKAGAAYVPLDPLLPAGRIEALVRQAEIGWVVTSATPPSNASFDGARIISWEAVPASSVNVNVPHALSGLAYVLFTSGSTGVPKAVAVSHGALANYCRSIELTLGIEGCNQFGIASTLCADLGHTMLFPSLTTGGTLHILPAEARLEGSSFADYLRRRPIDYLKIVPSHFAALTEQKETPAFPRKALVFGGEAASPAWVERLFRLAQGCAIFNHYGPTETTVGILTWRAGTDQFPLSLSSLPLRDAVANVEIHVLDAQGQPVPDGCAGELHVGGVCLAEGYFNDPVRTAESFLQTGSGRLYRTGDRVRRLHRGGLEFLGRADRQVKIRGYRVEPGWVEAVLSEDPLVRQCVVFPDQEGPGAGSLHAAVVPRGGDLPPANLAAELRNRSQRQLPPPLVPSRILVLEAIPLTANGKIDTARLRHLAGEEAPAVTRQQPGDWVEWELCTLWSELTGVRNISVTDNFFALGGNSLLAVRLGGRIEARFQRRLPLAAFLTHPTIERMASLLRGADKPVEHSVAVPLRPGDGRVPVFFLPGAGGNLLYFHPLVRQLDIDRACWGLQALGLEEGGVPPGDIPAIARHYLEIIRRQIQPVGPYQFVGHSFGALVAFEMSRQLLEQGETIGFLGLVDNAAPGRDGSLDYHAWDDARWLAHIGMRIEKLSQASLRLDPERLTGRTREQQNEYFIGQMKAAGLLPVGADVAHFTRFIEVYKANARAAIAYRPAAPPLPVILTLFRAEHQDAELFAHPDGDVAEKSPALGWENHARDPVDVVAVPGSHLTMFHERHAAEFALRLGQRLGQSSPRLSRPEKPPMSPAPV